MEQYILFNPKLLTKQQTKPKRKIKTAGPRSTSNNILFPDYFKHQVQSTLTLERPNANMGYSRQLMKRSEKQNMENSEFGRTKYIYSRAQTRQSKKTCSDWKFMKSDYQSFYKRNGEQPSIGLERKIQSHNQPRYLVKKNNRWTINKIQRNIVKNFGEATQQPVVKSVKQTEDFVLMMQMSYGIRYLPSTSVFTISSDSHKFVLNSISKRPWWKIQQNQNSENISLVWKQKATLEQSKRYKIASKIYNNNEAFDYLKKQYNISKMLWPNSKPKQNSLFIRPQPPYLQQFRQQIYKKIPTHNCEGIKLFAKIGHKKYLNNTSLYRAMQNNGKYFPKTYFKHQQNMNYEQSKRWVINQNNQLRIVDSKQLKTKIKKHYNYFQQFNESSVSKNQRTKCMILVVSLNGLLKVYLYEQFVNYQIAIEDEKITRINQTIPQISYLFIGKVGILLNSLFKQIYNKLLTKLNCFEIFQVEIIPCPQTPLFTSIKSINNYQNSIYENIIQNVFLIVIDILFKPPNYNEYTSSYNNNKFNLVFDSIISTQV